MTVLELIRANVRRLHDSEGATAVEYGIMVALIAVVIIVAVFIIGRELESDFSCVGDALQQPSNSLGTNCS